MAAASVDCVHTVTVSACIDARAILDGHAELLAGACDRCGQTLVALYTNSRLPQEWIEVSKIVRTVRRYRRQEVAEQLLGTTGQSLEAGS
ncbi:hypothetical protein [Fodinicola acaciae]|uniref:hypothetical protein n=1 Tax=Fodinicola acaciae TaxID=2681555 RepID=UPI0013D156A9|nr:hypothetical protein [Fodinicola acaciae]